MEVTLVEVNRKKSGSALILAIGVLALLIVVSASILKATVESKILTTGTDQSMELKLQAQSAVEKAVSILKEKIAVQIKNDSGSLDKDPTKKVINTSDFSNSILVKIANNENVGSTGLFSSTGSGPDLSKTIYYNIYGLRTTPYNNSDALDTPGDTSIDFSSADTTPASLGYKVNCIKISIKTRGKNHVLKSVDAYIDKNSISDAYYDMIIHNAVNVLSDSSSTGFSCDADSNIKIAGNIYLQGGNMNITPGRLMINGNIKTNPGTSTSQLTLKQNGYSFYDIANPYIIDPYIIDPFGGKTPIPGNVTEVSAEGKSLSDAHGSLTDTNERITTSGVIYLGSGEIDFANKKYNTVPQLQLDTSNTPNAHIKYANMNDTIANTNYYRIFTGTSRIYGCAVDAEGGPAVDFDKLILGFNLDSYAGMRKFISYDQGYGSNKEDSFSNDFKVIIVNGDLNIDGYSKLYDSIINVNNSTVNYVDDFKPFHCFNYIILCNGTVKIRGNVKFESSSIIAKNIVVTNDRGKTGEFKDLYVETDPDTFDINAPENSALKALCDAYQNLIEARYSPNSTSWGNDRTGSAFYPSSDSEDAAVGSALINARTVTGPPELIFDGIGTKDSIIEYNNYINLLQTTDTSPELRGYLTNDKRALIISFLIKNFSGGSNNENAAAANITMKIVEWDEK